MLDSTYNLEAHYRILWGKNNNKNNNDSSSNSNLDKEQHGLMNFDEISALWYFTLATWYGYLAFQNWKLRRRQHQQQQSRLSAATTTTSSSYFTAIHWFVLSITIMGLGNFLFSFSLLEVIDHRSIIGSNVRKLSYMNLILACLRHPCTLSLGVLAPKIAFHETDESTNLTYSINSQGRIRITERGNIQSTAMCLAALSIATVVVLLAENMMVLFRYGGRSDSRSVKLADFFEIVLDGIFLGWMTMVMYQTTIQISREYGGRLAWWKSKQLIQFWILYSIFVSIATIQTLIEFLYYVIVGTSSLSEHFIYTFYKVHGMNDLLLLTGISIFLRPRIQQRSQGGFDNDGVIIDDDGLRRSGGITAEGADTINYSLLLANDETSNDDNIMIHNEAISGMEDDDRASFSFEMTTNTQALL